MKISINILAILKAIQSEYGNNELLYRLYKILNINLLNLIDADIEINFKANTIIINDEHTTYKITFTKEYYLLTKKENNYETRHYFDLENKQFRKTVIFYQEQDDPIILDEINEQKLKNRRLLKTTKEDKDFLNPYFEKEISTLHQTSINERYLFNLNKTQKEISTPNHLCTYTSQELKTSYLNKKQQGTLEVSSSIYYFPPKFLGRIRNKYELFKDSIKKRFPNILIRENILEDDQLTTYEIRLFKISNFIFIIFKISNPLTNSHYQKNIFLNSKSNNSLTIQDIDNLMNYISTNIDIPFISEILIELSKIKDQILVHKQKQLRDIDIFDFKFALFDTFEKLAFDIYSNLSYYNDRINDFINPPTEKPPILKK